MVPDSKLPSNVLAALASGDTIVAIKLLREASGLGLKEAKDVIDAYQRGDPFTIANANLTPDIPADVIQAMQRGKKIEAIRLLREHTGLGLKEAKDVVEALNIERQYPPGSEPQEKSRLWLAFVVIVAVMLAYHFLAGSA